MLPGQAQLSIDCLPEVLRHSYTDTDPVWCKRGAGMSSWITIMVIELVELKVNNTFCTILLRLPA